MISSWILSEGDLARHRPFSTTHYQAEAPTFGNRPGLANPGAQHVVDHGNWGFSGFAAFRSRLALARSLCPLQSLRSKVEASGPLCLELQAATSFR